MKNKNKKKGFDCYIKQTIVYLIKHAETVDENGMRNTSEDSQLINEKEILSVEGEEQAKKLSKNNELRNLEQIDY